MRSCFSSPTSEKPDHFVSSLKCFNESSCQSFLFSKNPQSQMSSDMIEINNWVSLGSRTGVTAFMCCRPTSISDSTQFGPAHTNKRKERRASSLYSSEQQKLLLCTCDWLNFLLPVDKRLAVRQAAQNSSPRCLYTELEISFSCTQACKVVRGAGSAAVSEPSWCQGSKVKWSAWQNQRNWTVTSSSTLRLKLWVSALRGPATQAVSVFRTLRSLFFVR